MKRFLPYTEEWLPEDQTNMVEFFDSPTYHSIKKSLSNTMAERNALLVNELAEKGEDNHSKVIMAIDDILRWLENFEFNGEEDTE